jgi:hypothetical protein
VIVNLGHALHEDECSVGRASVLAFLSDDPPVLRSVVDGAVVCGDSLQLDLDVSSDGSANSEVRLLLIMGDKDFILDHLLVLVTADPSWPGSQYSIFIERVVSCRSEDKELVAGRGIWLLLVRCLVKVVMDYFAKINQSSLLELYFDPQVYLYS